MNISNTTLLVAFHSFAGMGPYVASIVNSFEAQDNVRFFLVEKEDQYYSKNIKESLKSKAIIVQTKSYSKAKTLLSLFFGFKCQYSKQIEDLCKKFSISIIHDLTGCTDYQYVKRISTRINWLYTVHDLYPHDSKKSFFKELRQKKLYKDIFKAISNSDYLITNSLQQYEDLKRIYPLKGVYQTPFPSLITQTIKDGGLIIPELKGIDKYILFFGRIEEYKGIAILLDAFKNIDTNTKLVIAGSGELPYLINDSRVIFINRYIADKEVEYLYKNSAFVVYPYISATQSGVLAVASYFNTPIIASDVPFFKEVLGNNYIGLFRNGDIDDLRKKLELFLNFSSTSTNQLKDIIANLYLTKYESQTQRQELLAIYHEINNINRIK